MSGSDAAAVGIRTSPAAITIRDPAELTLDGNEAAARVAYALSDVIAIYPITPASPMGEFADTWAQGERTNRWGAIPRVIEMQSEGGSSRGGTWRPAGWGADDNLHRLAGVAADAPQPLQDRRRADARGHPCGRSDPSLPMRSASLATTAMSWRCARPAWPCSHQPRSRRHKTWRWSLMRPHSQPACPSCTSSTGFVPATRSPRLRRSTRRRSMP